MNYQLYVQCVCKVRYVHGGLLCLFARLLSLQPAMAVKARPPIHPLLVLCVLIVFMACSFQKAVS